jgi:hypothetical protein
MMASTHIGTLEMVTDLGIFAALSDLDEYEEEEPAVTTFYPWSSVLWLRPLERA